MQKLIPILLLTSIVICFSCPSVDRTQGSTWRITAFQSQNFNITFEKLEDSSGYLSTVQPFGVIRLRFKGAGSVTVSLSPSQLGFLSTTIYNATATQISTTLNEEVIAFGNTCTDLCVWNITFDDSPVCVGFGDPSDTTQYFEICPNSGEITPGSTCKSYGCYPCHCNCETCTGPEANMCTTCPSGRFKLPSSRVCTTQCPIRYYSDTTDNTCKPCDPSCIYCTGPSNTDCTLCESSYSLQPNSTTCLNSCPEGYGFNTSRVCVRCTNPCATCLAANATSCTSCNAGYFLQTYSDSKSMCILPCESGYYGETSSQTCKPCDLGCATCTAPGLNSCSTCNDTAGYFLLPYSTTCSQTCPDGYYKGSFGYCMLCDAVCQTCENLHKCTSCNSPYFLRNSGQLRPFTCQLSCPDGYYGDNTTSWCTLCDSRCTLCSGPSYTQCTQCKTGYYLDPRTLVGCLSSCPEGYYGYPNSNICFACYYVCSTCSGGTNLDCTSCSSGYYLQPTSNQCLTSCPAGYYKDTTLRQCGSCHPFCATCSGSESTQCSSCSTGFFLQPSSTTCSTSCPAVGYWSDSSKNTCSPCHAACSVCTGPNNNQCSACKSKYFLQPNSTMCLNNCGNGYWPDTSANICSPCAPTCTYCIGPSPSDCVLCSQDLYYNPLTKGCTSSCTSGYYANDINRRCNQCDSACATCFGASNSNCSSCHFNYFLQPSSKLCLPNCPPGSWPDSSSRQCNPCDPTCRECAGPGSGSCVSCSSGYYQQADSNGCDTTCPEGYFADNTTNTCIPCNKACASCTGPSNTQCLACNSGYYLQPAPNNTMCLVSCPSSNYCPDDGTSTCELCGMTRKWSFSIAILQPIWFAITLLIVRTVNKNYSFMNRFEHKNEHHVEKQRHWFSKFVISWLVTHPLLAIYIYKDRGLTKSERLLLFFVRILMMFDIAASVHQSKSLTDDDDLSFSKLMSSFDRVLFIIPFFVLIPTHVILEKILRTPRCAKRINTSKSNGYLLVYIIILICVIFSFSLCYTYNLNHYQTRWLANWIKLLLQDLLFSPFIYLIFSLLMIEYVIKKEDVTPRVKNIAKKLIDESLLLINSIFEAENTILGRMFEEHVIPVNAVQFSESPITEKEGQLQITSRIEGFSPASKGNYCESESNLLPSWRAKNTNDLLSMEVPHQSVTSRDAIIKAKPELIVLDMEMKIIEKNMHQAASVKKKRKKKIPKAIPTEAIELKLQDAPNQQDQARQTEPIYDDAYIPNPEEIRIRKEPENDIPQQENYSPEREGVDERKKPDIENDQIILEFTQAKPKVDASKVKKKKKKKKKVSKKPDEERQAYLPENLEGNQNNAIQLEAEEQKVSLQNEEELVIGTKEQDIKEENEPQGEKNEILVDL